MPHGVLDRILETAAGSLRGAAAPTNTQPDNSMFTSLLLGVVVLAPLFPLSQASPGVSSRSEDVRYPSGELTLAAELLLPESDPPHAAAVVLQGSGDSDRSNAWAAEIAHEFVRNGVAVLLTDKRGCGASEGDWRTAGFNDLAGDALAGVRYLRGRKEVDPERVGLLGLSQGGWVAPLAAARSSDVAFIVDVSGCAVSFAEQSLLEMTNTLRQAGFSGEQALAELGSLQRAAGRYALGGDWEGYAAARERALASEWKAIAAEYPDRPDAPIWGFLGDALGFDPLPYWLQVEVPVLVFYGEEDERDNVPVRESVRRLERIFALDHRPAPTIHVVPAVGHALLVEPDRFAPEFVDGLKSWIEQTLAR
jgi:uncharacterized protein